MLTSSLTAVPGPSLTPIVGCLSELVDVDADRLSDVTVSVRTTALDSVPLPVVRAGTVSATPSESMAEADL